MDHRTAERLISERLDGERLSPRQAPALEGHLQTCASCRAFERWAYRLREEVRFEVAPAVPDLVEPIMASIAAEATRGRPRLRLGRTPRGPQPRRALLPRLAPALAGLLAGLVAGSLIVGGPWRDRSALAASDVAREVAAAAPAFEAYQARFAITEYHLSPEVPVRELSMNVWFAAPERFRLDVTDHTDYGSPATPTDLRLVVNGSAWYSSGPAACPSATCPHRETLVRNRAPFSEAAPVPTDIVLPLTTLGDDRGVQVLGAGTVLGRAAVRVELPFERAGPLFPFLELGGEWRPFFHNDRVRIWLDEASWFPLRWEVYPAGGHERDAWALRFGLPEEPSRRAVFTVDALSVELVPPAEGVFAVPETARAEDQGARPVSLAEVPHEVGFEPIAPRELAGLELYRVVVPAVEPAETLVTYAEGLAFLKVGETRSWSAAAPFGPVGLLAEEVRLPNGGLAYFEPATSELGRRLSIHAAGTDLYLESNLPREELLEVAASLPVTGLAMPEIWRVRRTPEGATSRATLEHAAEVLGVPIQLPRALPQGFALASVELVWVQDRVGATLHFHDTETALAAGPIRLHLEAADELPPAAAADQRSVEVRGAVGRYSPSTARLEWIEDGLYRSIDAPGLGLQELLELAASIPTASGGAAP